MDGLTLLVGYTPYAPVSDGRTGEGGIIESLMAAQLFAYHGG